MIRFYIVIAIVWTFASCQGVQVEHGQSAERAGQNKYIDALVSASDLNVVYVNDGAADASVMEKPVPEVKDIINLGAEAIPVLIEHLDDGRSTVATYNWSKEKGARVSVGHICLDILTSIVDAPQILVEDCADDGLGACVKEGYYFAPDEASHSAIENVKANWQRAYLEGRVKFKHPAWLR